MISLALALAAQSASLGVMNQQIAATWSEVQPAAQTAIQNAVAGFVGSQYSFLTVQQAQLLQLNLASPPKVMKLKPTHIAIKLPDGGWTVKIKLKLKADLGWFTTSFWVTAKLSNLQLKFQAWLSTADPFRPKIVAVAPWLKFNLSLSSTNFAANLIVNLIQGVLGSSLTQAIVNVALTGYLSWMVYGAPGPIPAEGDPMQFLAPAADLAGIAAEMRAATMAGNMPQGCVVDAIYSNATGQLVGYGRHGDSAIYTGHMLAGQAFAYAETGDPQAKAMALSLLAGIQRLLDVGSSPAYQIGAQAFTGPVLPPNALGRLVRYAAKPGDLFSGAQTFGAYYPAKSAASGNPMAVATINGELWYGHPGGISRDQYTGVVQGLAMAHVLLDDPAAKAIAKECLTRILNYILYKNWILDEPTGQMTTSFMGTPIQQAAFALAAKEANPAAFSGAAQTYGAMADLGWFQTWSETFDPHGSYFKFDLSFTSLQVAMYLETNPQRWQWHWYAMRVGHREIGHHQNPYFTGLYGLEQPWLAGTVAANVQESLEQFVARPRDPLPKALNTPEAVAYLQSLPTTVNEPILPFSISIGGEIEEEDGPEAISVHIVPMLYRPARAYLWGRSPFSIEASAAVGASTGRYPAADYQLGYWMARHAALVP